MFDPRDEIVGWIRWGSIPGARYDDALRVAGVIPSPAEWRVFMKRVLMLLGAAMLAAGAVYFIAANWQALGRHAKFALVEAALVIAVGASLWRGIDSLAGRAALFVAAVLMGVLLALVGQVYQTGADTFELFAAWAVAIVVWVAVARQGALWLLLLAIVNLAIVLYFKSRFGRGFGVDTILFGSEAGLWYAFALDAIALVVWEWQGALRGGWLAARSAPRAIAVVAGGIVTWLLAWHLAARDFGGFGPTWLAYAAWIAAMYWAYRVRTRDLFMLSGTVLSLVVIVTFALGRPVLKDGGAFGFLLIGIILIVCGAAGGYWLRQVSESERRAA